MENTGWLSGPELRELLVLCSRKHPNWHGLNQPPQPLVMQALLLPNYNQLTGIFLRTGHLLLYIFYIFNAHLRTFFSLLLETEEGREEGRERDKHRWNREVSISCLPCASGPEDQRWYMPDWGSCASGLGIEPATLQPTEPHWPGLFYYILRKPFIVEIFKHISRKVERVVMNLM